MNSWPKPPWIQYVATNTLGPRTPKISFNPHAKIILLACWLKLIWVFWVLGCLFRSLKKHVEFIQTSSLIQKVSPNLSVWLTHLCLHPSSVKREEEWIKQAEVFYYSLEGSNAAGPQLKHNPWSLKCHQQHLQRMKENAKHRNQYSILQCCHKQQKWIGLVYFTAAS